MHQPVEWDMGGFSWLRSVSGAVYGPCTGDFLAYWMGSREHLQHRPIFDGKHHGFLWIFPLNQSIIH